MKVIDLSKVELWQDWIPQQTGGVLWFVYAISYCFMCLVQDGHPPLGWSDMVAYLVLPVLLVVSQYVSMEIMKPPQLNYYLLQSPALSPWISCLLNACGMWTWLILWSRMADWWYGFKELTSHFSNSFLLWSITLLCQFHQDYQFIVR